MVISKTYPSGFVTPMDRISNLQSVTTLIKSDYIPTPQKKLMQIVDRPHIFGRETKFLRYSQYLQKMKYLLAFARFKEKMLKITLFGLEVYMSNGFLELST